MTHKPNREAREEGDTSGIPYILKKGGGGGGVKLSCVYMCIKSPIIPGTLSSLWYIYVF
jgi:hypothetical protein